MANNALSRRQLLMGMAATGGLGGGPPGAAERRYAFVQWDVFTAKPLTGNPLAVFGDARGLTDAEMQALASETNLSETTFVFPREAALERGKGVVVRIFTPTAELPFAGHPTLGTAMQVRSTTMRGAARVVLELTSGPIPVAFEDRGDGSVFGEMTQKDALFGESYPRDVVAPLIGLPADAIADDVPIQAVSTGSAFVVLPLRTLQAVRSVRMNFPAIAELLAKADRRNFYLVTREVLDAKARLHARFPFARGEDPVTGSAGGCACAWMVRHGVARPDEPVIIEQGLEVQRPGQLFVRASQSGDRVTNVRVGGFAVKVMQGEYAL
jgi:trans-2,3-dihydro-3-hydroxyanthranilate isomerase